METAYTPCAADTAGAELDRNVTAMTGEIAMPRANGELVFDAPWQSRAFGMAVSLSKAGHFTWDTFRGELARAIREHGQNGVDEYYLRWLDALEASMAGSALIDHEALHAREHEFRDGVRDEVF
ncbi:nitrile hydratase accessory protein [Paraburkholderia tropica]|uniref:Nitrile hydratase accessory protein n=1 Tax=Paraburkholderia tropica TaxID=92647 RepID=A0AAQ1GDD9_9BURK|nr:nitrile hydratase accessory protein [Paraburkholderia tropica]RQN40298.1 nitrile hydratase accessory protein [Paraburkholderia tropica]SEJ33090.1 nitrile hydratase accessory protein [Paraburkholderia tropica]